MIDPCDAGAWFMYSIDLSILNSVSQWTSMYVLMSFSSGLFDDYVAETQNADLK
jgi:hypothetical protein